MIHAAFCIYVFSIMSSLPTTVEECHAEIEWLRHRLALLEKYVHGRRSEKYIKTDDSAQTDLFAPEPEATKEEVREELSEPKEPRRRSPRKPLPANLPRVDVVIAPEEAERTCTCGREKAKIGEDVTEKLEFVPARLYVKRYIRPKFACPCCKNGVAQADLPPQPVPRAGVGSTLLAQLIVSKYADHIPLCRTERILARHGIELPRARMCDWVMSAAELLAPVYTAMKRRIGECAVIGADETPIDMQDPGSGKRKTKRCWMWVYRGDDTAPYTIFDFRQSRAREGPEDVLAVYTGFLQTDAYAAYRGMQTEGTITPVGCWAHARRHFVEAQDSGNPLAHEAIALIGRLYAVEKDAREFDAEQRKTMRQERSNPVLDQLHAWLEARLDTLPKTPLGKAVGYALDNWAQLTVYTTDGRLAIDNNAVERAIRPLAVGRKNWLFMGSPRGGRAAAIFFTLIESARRAGLNPWTYIHSLLELVPAWPINKIHELLPNQVALPVS